MAIGLLGAAASSPLEPYETVVYTVPSGISHSVVHINALGTGIVLVNSVFLLSVGVSAGQVGLHQDTSIMLSPGDVVSVTGNSGNIEGTVSCVVSGYEVPS